MTQQQSVSQSSVRECVCVCFVRPLLKVTSGSFRVRLRLYALSHLSDIISVSQEFPSRLLAAEVKIVSHQLRGLSKGEQWIPVTTVL